MSSVLLGAIEENNDRARSWDLTFNQVVVGSIPTGLTIGIYGKKFGFIDCSFVRRTPE
jgi:hypothetical protein